MEKLYTCEEIAERFQVQVATVWDWIRTGKLAAIKIGRIYRVYESAVIAFEQANFKKV